MTSDTTKKSCTSAKDADRQQAIEYLKESVKQGDTVYTILRHVSKSGMSRLLDLYLIKNNQPLRITWNAARALQVPYDRRHEALRIGGCGMDMGFAVVYNLGWVLFNGAGELKHQWI